MSTVRDLHETLLISFVLMMYASTDAITNNIIRLVRE